VYRLSFDDAESPGARALRDAVPSTKLDEVAPGRILGYQERSIALGCSRLLTGVSATAKAPNQPTAYSLGTSVGRVQLESP
jgi:hypothetical protein